MVRGLHFLLFVLIFMAHTAMGQRKALSMPEHDDKKYYFGISFAVNSSIYKIKYTDVFAATDTFLTIQPRWQPGFNLGLLANLKLTNFVDLRFVPSLAFAGKQFDYRYGIPKDSFASRSLEAIYVHLPLHFKLKSDRIENFRFYALVGGKLDYDLASNARSRRTDEFIKVNSIDYGFEVGVGFEFFNDSFIFSPEIKLSQGMVNQLYKDRSLPLTNSVDGLFSRTIVVSIHLEG